MKFHDEGGSILSLPVHPLCFFKLEDTAGIIIALVSAVMSIPAVIRTGDSFYADMRIFNEIPR